MKKNKDHWDFIENGWESLDFFHISCGAPKKQLDRYTVRFIPPKTFFCGACGAYAPEYMVTLAFLIDAWVLHHDTLILDNISTFK